MYISSAPVFECICVDFGPPVYTFNYYNAHSGGLSRSIIYIHLVLSDGHAFNQLCAETTYYDYTVEPPVRGIFVGRNPKSMR